jgi:predicted secreted acid phosphatase
MTVQRSERVTRVAVMLRFETKNGSIKDYRDSKYKQGQKDKTKFTKKNKEVFGIDYLIF